MMRRTAVPVRLAAVTAPPAGGFGSKARTTVPLSVRYCPRCCITFTPSPMLADPRGLCDPCGQSVGPQKADLLTIDLEAARTTALYEAARLLRVRRIDPRFEDAAMALAVLSHLPADCIAGAWRRAARMMEMEIRAFICDWVGAQHQAIMFPFHS